MTSGVILCKVMNRDMPAPKIGCRLYVFSVPLINEQMSLGAIPFSMPVVLLRNVRSNRLAKMLRLVSLTVGRLPPYVARTAKFLLTTSSLFSKLWILVVVLVL